MLVDGGPAGRWAAGMLAAAADLSAPHLVMFEAANVLRRHQLARIITADQAAQATPTSRTFRSSSGPTNRWPGGNNVKPSPGRRG